MWTSLRYLFPAACEGCGGPSDGRLCAGCLALAPSVAAPIDGLAWVVAFAPYESGLARALRGAKYGADRALMRVVARRFAEGAAPLAVGFDAVVPIPSPWTRRLHRGFAPAAVLAQQVARAAGIPVADVLRVAPGPRQAGMTGRARRGNLRGRLRAASPVSGRVLLVDDVSTTGATLAAAARELLGDRTDRVCGVVLSARPGTGAVRNLDTHRRSDTRQVRTTYVGDAPGSGPSTAPPASWNGTQGPGASFPMSSEEESAR